MATWAIAGRSTSTLMRATWRTTTARESATARIRLSDSVRSWTRPNLTLRQSRISPSSPVGRFVRRELSSVLPLHSAIASACLVSKLPSELSTSAEGRFANYLSPI
ncbi:uncharacterized protein LOC110612934 [Manihot esculenta]|uniref:Uncharacterized protein n=1 Tax=Manihot esculenta TaxID=3983 RepID=A0A251LEW6_MANES|nr:uncharacterized protein LOC110612934 [Manihot esculenta]OAY51454.1 hypothetical protein MANES_04G008100v8 [Manihot esculenta]OAY51455.1 hypothetical protein MANES_04G008100v8 [Manihot esculenta]OAY51456.1 hypothetical protein MANES_04G008100v8 [Manihot esculenta]